MATNLEALKEYWNQCITYYAKIHRKMRMLDAADSGELWAALNAKYPSYQILPDSNYIAYVKNNMLASLYTVVKSAEIMPTSENDKEICMHLNIALDRIWSMSNVGFYQFKAGDRAALLNLGITQVGWSEQITGGAAEFSKGNIVLKNIDPIKFMRDPFAVDVDNAAYVITYDYYHKSIFERNPLYKDEFKKFLNSVNNSGTAFKTPENYNTTPGGSGKDYYTLITFWVREGADIVEYHTVNLEHVLYTKKIKPAIYPFALLYCNLPGDGKLIGTSEPARIFANNLAYNLMNSIALTSEYKNQQPPKFISKQSGLNVNDFAKHGDEANRTFIVNGLAKDAAHYHQFPQISQVYNVVQQSLGKDIEQVTGVDGRYTGRDTGSIITTGGTEEMLNRVTLVDSPRIINYENYTKRLTQLILSNYLHFAPARKYFFKKKNSNEWDTVTLDFPSIPDDTVFDYQLNISSELPKNKQRIAAVANTLMEKQMQYREQGDNVQLITPEEWLMMQDLPNKEYMLERMGIQRIQDATEDVSQVLFQYADLVAKGVDPDEAIQMTAQTLDQKRKGQTPKELPIPPTAGNPMAPPTGGGGLTPPTQPLV